MNIRKQIEQVLSPGEKVYVKTPCGIEETTVIGLEPLGVDSEYDFLPYDERRTNWWLTSVGAKEGRRGTR